MRVYQILALLALSVAVSDSSDTTKYQAPVLAAVNATLGNQAAKQLEYELSYKMGAQHGLGQWGAPRANGAHHGTNGAHHGIATQPTYPRRSKAMFAFIHLIFLNWIGVDHCFLGGSFASLAVIIGLMKGCLAVFSGLVASIYNSRKASADMLPLVEIILVGPALTWGLLDFALILRNMLKDEPSFHLFFYFNVEFEEGTILRAKHIMVATLLTYVFVVAGRYNGCIPVGSREKCKKVHSADADPDESDIYLQLPA